MPNGMNFRHLIPDSILLSSIKPQHAHCDTKSEEKFTKRIKKKYKLAGEQNIPYVYIFFTIDSDDTSCHKPLTIEVVKTDWENKTQNHLENDRSYIDVCNNLDILSKDDILSKKRDGNNGLLCVAKLSDVKYQQMLGLKERVGKTTKYVSPETQEIIKTALGETNISDKALEKLGLN